MRRWIPKISSGFQSASDNFDTAVDGALLSSRTNWGVCVGNLKTLNPSGSAGSVVGNAGSDQVNYYTALTWSQRQKSTFTLGGSSFGNYVGAAVRCSVNNGYFFAIDNNTCYLAAYNGGVKTDLTNAGSFSTISPADLWSIEAVGNGSSTRLTVRQNGNSVISAYDPAAVAYISSGSPGVYANGTSTSTWQILDWAGVEF